MNIQDVKGIQEYRIENVSDIPDYYIDEPKSVLNILEDNKFAASTNRARKLVDDGLVMLFPDGTSNRKKLLRDPDMLLLPKSGAILKVEKRKYIRFKNSGML